MNPNPQRMTRARRIRLGLVQLAMVALIIGLYLVLVTRGRILGELPW